MADVSEVDTTALTPTDLSTTLSVTLDSSKSRAGNTKDRLDITRDDLEKCQLLHTIQLLKLQTSQKQLVIDTCHNKQASQIEELRELLADAQHEKRLLSLRVQSLSHGYEQELKRTREKLEEERAKVCRENVDERDCQTVREEVKQELELALSTCSLLDEAQYRNLKSADSAGLPIEDLVRVRLHEITEQLQKQCNDFQGIINHLNQELQDKESELALSEENLMQANDRVCQQEEECSNLAMELKLVKTQVLEGNYKVNNFDTIKKERDTLRLKVGELQATLSGIETKHELIHQELNRLTKELSAVQQSEALLHHDKEYLSRQVGDLTQKVGLAEERMEGMREEVLAAGQSREDMLKQLMKCREEKTKECDRWMEVEMEGLKARTALEIDQLKAQTREMYERENKVLIEVRDSAVLERDRAKATEKEANDKYESLLKDHHSLQTLYSKHLSELQGDLQVTRFEKERTGLVHQETIKGIRQLQLEQEKLQKKVELLTQELQACESDKELQVKSLETQLQGTQQQLQGYEKIEKELDDIVMESAQMEHSCDAERVLFSYGFGTSVPTHSKRRLQQSVQLARRVLLLEKINVSLRDRAKRDEEKIAQLTEELTSGRKLLEGAQQPYTYLVSRIKEQKELLDKSKQRISQLEEEVNLTRREKAALIEAKNQMAADLERLLNHREEIRLMKAVLLGGTKQGSPPDPFSSSSQVPKHTTGLPSPSHLPHPIPTVFTKQ